MASEEDILREIQSHCEVSNRPYTLTAYGMKAIFERLLHDYIPEATFIRLMERSGYKRNKCNKFMVSVIPDERIEKCLWGNGK